MEQRKGASRAQKKLAHFSAAVAEDTSVKIQGARYDAVDTKDGWYTLKDVLFFAEVPKGEKNAPETVKADRMHQMVKSAAEKYEREKFAAPAHKGHHKAIAFEDPEFLGFMLPKRVGRTTLDGREQDAVYGDVKVKSSAFERIKKGELPYVSPEVDWSTWTFSSLAFLDSMPPHFKGPIITVGKVTEDATAKFTVGATFSKGLFMALDADKGKGAEEKPKLEDKPAKEGDDLQAINDRLQRIEMTVSAMDKSVADVFFKMGLPYKGAQMEANRATQKSDSSAPVEDDHSKGNTVDEKKKEPAAPAASNFQDDPAVRATFAALEMKNKALEDRLNKRDAEEALKARVAGAFEELKGYPLTDTVKADIAHFAKDEADLKRYVAGIIAQTPKNPPRTVAEFESSGKEVKTQISGTDPDLASFQAKGPEAMEAALRYAARFEAMKADKACKGSKLMAEGRKVFVEQMMELDPTGNFGRKKVS